MEPPQAEFIILESSRFSQNKFPKYHESRLCDKFACKIASTFHDIATDFLMSGILRQSSRDSEKNDAEVKY